MRALATIAFCVAGAANLANLITGTSMSLVKVRKLALVRAHQVSNLLMAVSLLAGSSFVMSGI